MDTSLLWTVCFVPGERKPLSFLEIQPTECGHPLIWTLSMALSVSVLMYGLTVCFPTPFSHFTILR